MVFLGVNLMRQNKSREGLALISEGLQICEDVWGTGNPGMNIFYGMFSLLSKEPKHAGELQPYLDRLGSVDRAWPYGRVVKDCDFTDEFSASVDFEDDQAEKIIWLDRAPGKDVSPRLWIFARPFNWMWQTFRNEESHCIRVNHNPEQEVSFNGALKFSFIIDARQWVPFEIPVEWLVQGENTFSIYERHEEGYEEILPWEYNNLSIGIDMNHNCDRSWWFGSTKCCEEMAYKAMGAEKPLLRDAAIITEHREKGYKECKGELMIFLELN